MRYSVVYCIIVFEPVGIPKKIVEPVWFDGFFYVLCNVFEKYLVKYEKTSCFILESWLCERKIPMPADIPFDAKGNLAEPIQTMVVSKSSINRFRGTAQDENLFSMEVMATPTVFEGTISGRFDQAELERLIHNGSCIGGYQTAGYGRCSIEVIEKTIFVDDRNQLRTRIHKCGQKIPVTLLSDAMVALE